MATPTAQHHARNTRPHRGKTDEVEDIISRLPPEEKHEVMQNTDIPSMVREKLRVLKTRLSPGQLGKNDSSESRAAVVLDFVCRQHSKTKLSLKTLSAMLGMKQVAFETLHTTIGNFLQTPAAAAKSRRPTRSSSGTVGTSRRVNTSTSLSSLRKGSLKRSRESTAAQASAPNRAAATIIQPPCNSSIPALSIRLGSLVHDSHGFAQQAEALLRKVYSAITTLPAHDQHGYLHDMERHGVLYEAACFYHVVVQSSTTITTNGQSTTRGGKRKSTTTSTSISSDSLVADDDPNNLTSSSFLEMKHVVDACNTDLRTFKTVLTAVEKLVTIKDNESNAETRKKKANSKQKQTSSNNNRKNNTSDQSKEASSSDRTVATLLDRAAAEEEISAAATIVEIGEQSFHRPIYSDAFLAWKTTTLQEACERVRRRRRKHKKADISDAVALQKAVERIVHENQSRMDS